jgi:hypothetical protein
VRINELESRSRDDDVIARPKQLLPFTPSGNVGPRVSAHYEKEPDGWAHVAFEARERFDRVWPFGRIQLDGRDSQPLITLRRQRQHRVTMKSRRHHPLSLMRRDVRRNKKKLVERETLRNTLRDGDVPDVNRIERPAVKSYASSSVHRKLFIS